MTAPSTGPTGRKPSQRWERDGCLVDLSSLRPRRFGRSHCNDEDLFRIAKRKIHCRSQNLRRLTLKYHYFKIPEIQSIYLRRGFTLVRIYDWSYVFADLAESAVASYALTATCAAPVGGR